MKCIAKKLLFLCPPSLFPQVGYERRPRRELARVNEARGGFSYKLFCKLSMSVSHALEKTCSIIPP
jgi:hypothetical protein